jgi:hypothetical protein
MGRRLSTPVRAALALLASVFLLWPLSSFYWCSVQIVAPTPEAPDPTTISSPISRVSLALLGSLGYDDTSALFQGAAASLAAIGFYCLISRVSEQSLPRETFCRKCRAILRNLETPQCPRCGEPI